MLMNDARAWGVVTACACARSNVTVRAVPSSTSIRKLIEQALEEAQAEFAEIVKRKLEALMGDVPEERPARRAETPKRPAAKAPASRDAKRVRTPESQMAELRQRVLSAMPVGEPLKRSRILELARLSPDDAVRVANILRRLKDEGIVTMRGARASATYTRKG